MAAKPKRNLKALRRMRTVFSKVPPHAVHMLAILHAASCGTVGCLWGHVRDDQKLMALPGYRYSFDGAAQFLGLAEKDVEQLFLTGGGSEKIARALHRNPHAISKRQVLSRLDAAIAGKPIRPYVVKGP